MSQNEQLPSNLEVDAVRKEVGVGTNGAKVIIELRAEIERLTDELAIAQREGVRLTCEARAERDRPRAKVCPICHPPEQV